MQITHSSTAKKEDKKEERGSCQTLTNIPLRSMLVNGGVPLKKTRNRLEAERRLTMRPRELANRQPMTLICSSFIILLIASGFENQIQCSWQDDVARRHYMQACKRLQKRATMV